MAARDRKSTDKTRAANLADSRTARVERYQQMLDRVSTSPAPGSSALYRKDLPLSDLKPGECGNVMRLNGNFCGRLRLLEMGLTPGTHVRMVRAAAFGGPVDIEVRGYQLSLRREEAAAVWLGDEDQP